ncbi:MAG: hypothetical protein KC414_00045 [Romboutsia sp.]|nr:hypothetical protein [Romboutsia sp.]
MISVRTLHYEFEKACNRLHTAISKDIASVDIDAFLNQAKDIILERYDEIVEKNRVLENHLRVLEVIDISLDKEISKHNYTLYSLPKDYFNSLRLRVNACTDKCEEPQEIRTKKYSQQDDLDEALKDPFRKPDWYWRRGLWNIVGDKIQFFHDNKYDIKTLELTYIKYLEDVAYAEGCPDGKYLLSDGITVIKENKDLNLPRNGLLWRKIVEIAAYLYKKSVDDNYKVEMDSFLFNQNIGVA